MNNSATKSRPNNKDDNFYGGSAIFMSSRNGVINSTTFKNNKGGKSGCFKIIELFDEDPDSPYSSSMKMLEENQNSILVSNCDFEHDQGETNSIFFIGNKDESTIEVAKCLFKGKLEKNSHYIKGWLHDKKLSRIKIRSCDFEFKNNQEVNFEFNGDVDNRNSIQFGLFSLDLKKIILCLAACSFTFAIALIGLMNRKRNIDNDYNYNYEDDWLQPNSYEEHI